MKFVDLAEIRVAAGGGGNGAVSFRREKYVPMGGPDGGTGGRGGNIVARANAQLATLLDFQYRRSYTARRGENGSRSNCTGRGGDDIVIEVPVGTIVRDTATGETIADLTANGMEAVIARGGRGGRGNTSFKNSTNQAPREHEPGEPGEERNVELELKLLADAGLVGLPNAGKSTLISVISAARPKIADYPFTTLVPNLGIVRGEGGASFVVADIPGLIEGAHQGRGLGLQFLRHIERTTVLVYLLEVTRGTMKEDYKILTNELKSHDPDLVKKKSIIALTKIDAVDAKTLRELKKMKFGRLPVHCISAVTGAGVDDLVRTMTGVVVAARKKRIRTTA